MDEKRPFLSSFEDRHGTTRWRFRRAGKTVSMLGQPGDPAFEAKYEALIAGIELKIAPIVPMPGRALPETFRAAWKKAQQAPEWLAHDDVTKSKNRKLAEEFLELLVREDDPTKWGDIPVKDMKRRHIKAIIAHFSSTPHKAKHMLVAIRKMIMAALDEEWIETDPTWKLNYSPTYKGWRAWTETEVEKFEARWTLGTTPRTAYALALWLGNRRSDIARLRWDWFDFERGTMAVTTIKGDKRLVLPITPMLREALASVERKGPTVLVTAYGEPFSAKSLTGRMADWTRLADLPKGCTIHGLRKTLGKMLAESGATTRQLMETLGHDNIEHAELYSREAEQERLARDAMGRLSRKYKAKKKPG